jgi:hypothetical protein
MTLPNVRSDNPGDFLVQLAALPSEQQHQFTMAAKADPDLSLEDWADEKAIELIDPEDQTTVTQ